MADKQITELTEASALTGEELLVVFQDGEARRVAAKKMAALCGGSGVGTADITLTSPDGTRYKITVANGGVLNVEETSD